MLLARLPAGFRSPAEPRKMTAPRIDFELLSARELETSELPTDFVAHFRSDVELHGSSLRERPSATMPSALRHAACEHAPATCAQPQHVAYIIIRISFFHSLLKGNSKPGFGNLDVLDKKKIRVPLEQLRVRGL